MSVWDWFFNNFLKSKRRPNPRPSPPVPPPTPIPPLPPIDPTPDPIDPSGDFMATLIDAHNAQRRKAGLSPLTISPALTRAAQQHADLMASKRTMSHQLPGEPELQKRTAAAGYHGGFVGENIAAGNIVTVTQVMNLWMASQGHRENILRPQFRDIGCGMTKYPDGQTWWAIDLGSTSMGVLELTAMNLDELQPGGISRIDKTGGSAKWL